MAQVFCHGVIVEVGHQEEGQEEEVEKQGEVEGEEKQLKDNRTSWMIWRWGEWHVNGLSLVDCDEWSNEDTKNSVQVCSILHVAHVDVRRVTLVIVHNGHEDVILVVK